MRLTEKIVMEVINELKPCQYTEVIGQLIGRGYDSSEVHAMLDKMDKEEKFDVDTDSIVPRII
jgi:hypothetical protein